MARLDDLLQAPMEGVARLVIRHERVRTFRWLFLVELALISLLCVCLVPVVILALLLTGNSGLLQAFELEDLLRRSWNGWHELVIERRGAGGEVLGAVRVRPASAEEGDALVRSVIQAADPAGVVVIQTLGGAASEHLVTWWSGLPLLGAPQRRPTETLVQALRRRGARVDAETDGLQVTLADEPRSRLGALLLLVFVGPLVVWTAGGRQALAEQWGHLRGLPPAETALEVRPDGLTVRESRAGGIRSELHLDETELLGIAWCAHLDHGQPPVRHKPTLTLLARHAIHRLALPDAVGPLLPELLIGAALDRRAPGGHLMLSCPYCATRYELAAAPRCPSCGAPPSDRLT